MKSQFNTGMLARLKRTGEPTGMGNFKTDQYYLSAQIMWHISLAVGKEMDLIISQGSFQTPSLLHSAEYISYMILRIGNFSLEFMCILVWLNKNRRCIGIFKSTYTYT